MNIRNDLVKDLVTSTNSSQGVLRKFNITTSGKTYYIKSGSSNGKLFRVKEPIIECIASQIGVILGFDVINYKLWTIDRYLFSEIEASEEEDISLEPKRVDDVPRAVSLERCLSDSGKVLVCISKSFRPSDDYSFVSCDQLFTGIKQQNLYETLINLGDGVKQQIDQMILFDYLINNTDRHRKNFGFLKSESSELRMAPMFDHGLSLFSEFTEKDIEEDGMGLLEYCDGKPFGDLSSAFRKYVKRDSLKNINFEVRSEDLFKVIDVYTPVLGIERTKIMKSVFEMRWEYARKLLLEI